MKKELQALFLELFNLHELFEINLSHYILEKRTLENTASNSVLNHRKQKGMTIYERNKTK